MRLWFLLAGCGSTDSPEVIAARTDLKHIVTTLEHSHPMPVLEPERFRQLLTKATSRAEMELDAAASPAGVTHALQRFIAAFDDPHLSLEAPEEEGWVWPGFVLSARHVDGGVVFVVSGSAGAVSEGTVLVSCDQRPLRDWLDGAVARRGGQRHGTWDDIRHAPRLTVGHSKDGLPSVCTDETGVPHTLSYTTVPESTLRWARWVAAYGPPAYTPALTRISDHLTWVRLPSFDLNKDTAEKMRAVLRELTAVKDAGTLVLDVRGNSGGSDVWGRRIVQELWGVDLGMPVKTVQWRVSEANCDWIRTELVPHSRKSDLSTSNALEGIATAMEQALGTDEALITETLDPPTGTPVPPGARVMLLTDAACSSACLLFVDRLKTLPGVVHIGESTAADTPYTEIRWFDLPSGATFTLPIKALGRTRGAHEAYTPTHVYSGDRTDADVQAWVKTLQIE